MNQTEIINRLVQEGDALVKAGRFAEGEARAREILARQPKSPGGQYVLGLSSMMQDRDAEALAYFDGALRADRVNPSLHFMAALCLGKLGRVDEAIASYRRALQYQPEFIEARANLGYLLEHTGRMEEAADCYRRAVAADPRDVVGLVRLAYCERLLGKPQEALATLGKALALQPRAPAVLNEMALAHLQLGSTLEAIVKLRQAVDADPKFAAGWANLAKLLYVEHVEAAQAAEATGAPAPDPSVVLECFDRLLGFDEANAEFRFLRDALAGTRVPAPPDGYVESFFDRFATQFEPRVVGELRYSAPEVAARVVGPWLEGRKDLRVADLGCGTGLSGAFVRPHAASLTGVDLSAKMLEIARARGTYDELAKAEIGEWLASRAPGSVDLALALDVFIYVGELDRIFESASKALAPAGRFVFTAEAFAGEGDYKLRAGGRYAHAPTYVAQVAQRAGLREAASESFDIRREAGHGVPALMYVFEKAAA